jgi:hypothetical protein
MVGTFLKIEISASVVAWYAAVISTVNLIVIGYNIWRDRAHIKIKYEPGMNLLGDVSALGYNLEKKYLSISVINRGRRPIRIEIASLKILKKKEFALLSDSFLERRKKVITEDSPTTTFLVDQDHIDIKNVWYVLIVDGTGRKYKKYINIFLPIISFFKK